MQNSSYLCQAMLVNTTKDLTNYPVDFHIVPSCSVDNCAANGFYSNDDGLVANLTGNLNNYTVSYF